MWPVAVRLDGTLEALSRLRPGCRELKEVACQPYGRPRGQFEVYVHDHKGDFASVSETVLQVGSGIRFSRHSCLAKRSGKLVDEKSQKA